MNGTIKIVEIVESKKTATSGVMVMAWNRTRPTVR